jgi:hypothetical protein
MPFKLQFTIRHLIIAIAVIAVCLALLPSPFGFLLFLVCGALPGYVIGRIRGGSGIIAGALSESACATAVFIALISLETYRAPWPAGATLALIPLACFVSVAGFIAGLVISSRLYALTEMTKHLFEPEPSQKAQDEIRYLPDGREEI